MPRYLKTTFPCRHCGEPARVERQRDAQFASCDPCSARQRALSMVAWADDSVQSKIPEAQKAMEDSLERGLILWLRILEDRVRAARHCVEALAAIRPGEMKAWARGSGERAAWSRRLLENLAPYLERLVEEARAKMPLQVIDGLGEVTEPVQPDLRFIPGDKGRAG